MTRNKRGIFRQLGWRELRLLAREVRAYSDWLQVRQLVLELFGERAHSIQLSFDQHEGRRLASVEWVTAYDSEMKPLSYDFTRPFWQRHLSAEQDAPTFLQWLDQRVDELAGEKILSKEERETSRQELANDFFETDRSFFSQFPADPDQRMFNLMQPPRLTFPFVFVPRGMPQIVPSKNALGDIERMKQGETSGEREEWSFANEGADAGGLEKDVHFACADCGEIAGLQWILNNRDLDEAEQKIRFLLGYGCDHCQSNPFPDTIPMYADLFLLRLIHHFLFTRLPTMRDRLHLLLTLSGGMAQMQQDLLNLPAQWRDE